MKKIRGFKLSLPPKETRRRLRKAADLKALALEEEAPWQALLEAFHSRLRASVIFDSRGPEEETPLSPIPGLAYTLGLCTLGADLGPWIEARRAESEPLGKLLDALARSALQECVHFVAELIQDEVAEERCTLSPVHHVSEPAALKSLTGKLPAEKIGVSFDGEKLSPPHALAFCLSWIKVRARAKAKASPSRK